MNNSPLLTAATIAFAAGAALAAGAGCQLDPLPFDGTVPYLQAGDDPGAAITRAGYLLEVDPTINDDGYLGITYCVQRLVVIDYTWNLDTLAHEYGHVWHGNFLGCIDMDQSDRKEAVAENFEWVYRGCQADERSWFPEADDMRSEHCWKGGATTP